MHGDGRCAEQRAAREQGVGQGWGVRWARDEADDEGGAMNPVDHPHGGGEGRTSGGRAERDAVGGVHQGNAHAE